MLKNNTIQFGTDEFSFTKRALLTARQPLDCSNQTACAGFVISGLEPADSKRRFVFKIDGDLFYFAGGQLVSYPHAGELDDILNHGNTAAELVNLDEVAGFIGKKIYPVVALEALSDSSVLPSVKMSLRVRNSSAVYEKNVETAEYELAAAEGATPTIAEVQANVICTGQATAEVFCRLFDEDWSDWLSLSAAKDKKASRVQFRLSYKVTTLDGTDSAKISGVMIKHTLGAAAVSGDVAEIYSVVKNYQTPLKTCYLVIKHKRLIDSTIEAYVNFMTEPLKRELIPIGTSSGTLQTLALGVNGVKDIGIDQNTIQLFADGVPFSGFSYNVAVSEVTINITSGKAITASYSYKHDEEEWLEMIKQIDMQPYDDGTYMTRFEYSLPDDVTDMKLSNVRIRLFRPTGTVANESLGLASGQVQQFVLAHPAKQETLRLNADNWSYDPDSQILTVVAQKDLELIISYDWIAEAQTIYGFTAGWCVGN